VKFIGPNTASITTPHAVTKAALQELAARWPSTIPFADLVAAARARVDSEGLAQPPAPGTDHEIVGSGMLSAYSADIVELRVLPCAFPTIPSQRPRATALARLQARGTEQVVSQQHLGSDLNRLARELLVRLDGSRTQSDVAGEVASLVAAGKLELVPPPGVTGDPRALVDRAVDETLRMLAKEGFLEA
jgi:hypothetical protein